MTMTTMMKENGGKSDASARNDGRERSEMTYETWLQVTEIALCAMIYGCGESWWSWMF